MYARLWWKETRTFWPIWVALGVVAVGVQGLLLWAGIPDVRTGMLIAQGVSWSMLYAFAVGAAALAGERETNTQVFLDTLPVGRRMVWTSKVSFALVTTLGLSLALAMLGAIGTTARDPARFPIATLALGFGVVLFEGIAWSLLWSVVLGSALQAAAVGLVTVGFVNILLARSVNLHDPAVLAPLAPLRLALAAAALGLSWVVFTRPPRADGTIRAREPSTPARLSRLGARRSQFGRLAWETVRESRRTWVLLTGIWLGLMLLASTRFNGANPEWLLCSILAILVSLFAGVSVFGPASRTRSYRFLAHHGVRPGVVWMARCLVWSIVMTNLLGVYLLTLVITVWDEPPWLVSLSFQTIGAFVIGLVSGQVVRRSITAWVLACLAFVLLALPPLALVEESMIPPTSLGLIPALALAISWAWTSDWMNDGRGPARWLRLGGMVGAAATLVVALYIGYRAWGVPDIDPPFALAAPSTASHPLAPDQDATEDYTRILRDSSQREPPFIDAVPGTVTAIIAQGWDSKRDPVVAWWDARRDLIGPLKRAAEKSEAMFLPHHRLVELMTLVDLLGLDSSERRSRGDLAGAWDDLRAVFRIATQISRSRGAVYGMLAARQLRTQDLQWALAWAADRQQTPEQLRAALAVFRGLPPLAPVADSLRSEYALFERMFRRGDEGDRNVLSPLLFAENDQEPWVLPHVKTLPWERERARRVGRLLFAELVHLAPLEYWFKTNANGFIDLPWTRGTTRGVVQASDLKWYQESTPLVRGVWWSVLTSILQPRYTLALHERALAQVLALRIWQLEHDGEYPESLAVLVPDPLPSLPLDPYSGRPFGYRQSEGQSVLPLGMSGLPANGMTNFLQLLQPTRPGQWLLYSVGDDGKDDDAQLDRQVGQLLSDLIFPLPDAS